MTKSFFLLRIRIIFPPHFFPRLRSPPGSCSSPYIDEVFLRAITYLSALPSCQVSLPPFPSFGIDPASLSPLAPRNCHLADSSPPPIFWVRESKRLRRIRILPHPLWLLAPLLFFKFSGERLLFFFDFSSFLFRFLLTMNYKTLERVPLKVCYFSGGSVCRFFPLP